MKKLEILKEAKERGFIDDQITGNIYGISGKLIGRKTKGYIHCTICISKKDYNFLGHIFAWYYIYGILVEDEIDHINKIRHDNRINNLRLVSRQENSFNTNAKGCYFNVKRNKWHVRIKLNGKYKHLGYFDSYEEGHNMYLENKKIYHII